MQRQNDAGGGRFREILGVLAKHKAAQGLTPQKLRAVVEDLGPTFVKLGQILSMRMDMLPAAYCRELAALRVDVKPMPFPEVRQAVEEEFGLPLEEMFSLFEEEPLGSASMAQVHAAVLPDGRKAAVKVQRPGIRETMAQDIRLLHKASKLIGLTPMGAVVDLDMVLDEMWGVAQEEMDFLIEAKNAGEFRRLNREVAYVESPCVVDELTTAKVLTMERVEGIPIDDLAALRTEEYDLEEVGLKLAENYIKQVLDDGFFHADPHPGNLHVRDGKLVWLDLGMMGRLSRRDRELLQDAVKAMVKGDAHSLEAILLTLCEAAGAVDHERLTGDIRVFLDKYGRMELGDMKLGTILEEMMGIASAHRLSLPAGVSMLGRGVLTLEGVLTAVSPDIDLIQIMANRMSAVMLRELDWKKTLGSDLRKALESGRKSLGLPAQISDWLSADLTGRRQVTVKLIGEEKRAEERERLAAWAVRSAFAVALLLGGCVLCLSEMAPRPLGMPVPAWLCFLGALLMGARQLWAMHRKR